MGVDVLDAIRRIGGRGRIHHVHFRAVRGSVPKFVETFVDDGDIDMLQAMRAYKEVDYQGSLVSDHTPGVVNDFAGGRVGRTFTHGYIRGLIQSVNAPPASNPNSGHRLKLAKGLRDLSDDTIAFFRQLGVEHVVMPTRFNLEPSKRGLIPATDSGPSDDRPLTPWKTADLRRIKDHLAERGLSGEMVHLPAMFRILHGRSDRDRELANVQESIRVAGEAGIPVVEYNFTPLRGSEGYGRTTGRGQSGLRDYDHGRTKDLPPLPNVGEHTREEMWERLEWFLKGVVPVAEESRVRLAMHPNDPPIPVFRGAAQPVRSLKDQRRLIELVDSPSNGITLDTGVTTEMGEDAAEAIRYFGSRDRINHVHFRNVRVSTPYYKYLEVMHDEGDCDMLACMRAFQEVRYPYLMIPDHTPEFTDDNLGNQVGWAFALGYLRALR
jgi:D-mannonate dehydratase